MLDRDFFYLNIIYTATASRKKAKIFLKTVAGSFRPSFVPHRVPNTIPMAIKTAYIMFRCPFWA